MAGRRTGIRLWSSVADLNFALALWVRGEWPEMHEFMNDRRQWSPGGDVASAAAIDAMLAHGLGREYSDTFDLPGEGDLPVAFDRAWLHFVRAYRSVIDDDPVTALGHAVRAAETYVGVADDFHHIWALAMDLAVEVGDPQEESRVLALVDGVNVAIPVGLRAHRARQAAISARRDGAPPDTVEHQYRTAMALYDEWGAVVFTARAQGELGAWLSREGRTMEAIPLLDAARTTLSAAGARRWLDDLDLALVRVG